MTDQEQEQEQYEGKSSLPLFELKDAFENVHPRTLKQLSDVMDEYIHSLTGQISQASKTAATTSAILVEASENLLAEILNCQDETLGWITQWDELHANLEPLFAVSQKLKLLKTSLDRLDAQL